MLRVKSKRNPKKYNPSLEHLRACVIDSLTVPEPTPGRYELELEKYKRDLPLPYLKTSERKLEKIGNIRF